MILDVIELGVSIQGIVQHLDALMKGVCHETNPMLGSRFYSSWRVVLVCGSLVCR